MRDKITVITGASRGLGESMAHHLAARGVAVVGTFHRSMAKAQAIAAAIEAARGQVAMLPLDVSSTGSFPDFAAALARRMADRFGRDRLDCLINNAGAGINVPFEQTTEDQFDRIVETHVKAPFFLTQALLPLISEGGQVLNISSNLTRFTVPCYAAYASAKAAVEALTRYQAQELGRKSIRVNVIAPGAIETDFAGCGCETIRRSTVRSRRAAARPDRAAGGCWSGGWRLAVRRRSLAQRCQNRAGGQNL
jgi:NAD(P)-dependent dehydrogenase (short-subunit alcohol dehydrogenase family)